MGFIANQALKSNVNVIYPDQLIVCQNFYLPNRLMEQIYKTQKIIWLINLN